MGAEVNMVDYAGVGGYDEDRVLEWEDGLPDVDDITPLSQILIPPGLATAFNIKPEPFRTLVDVNRASRDTLSGLRGSQKPAFVRNDFKPFNENNGSRDSAMEEIDDDRPDSRRIQRMDSMDEEDSTLRGENSNMGDDSSARALKRPRLVWTPQLHKRFVDVVSHLGIKNAVPKTTMQLMNVEGLTRENVASHLQKYRLYLKRMQGFSNEGPSSSDQLFASTPVPQSLRDSGSSGHTNGHVQMPVPMHYGSAMVPMQMVGHGQMGMPMSGYSGMEAHHQHAYGMMQQRNWSGMSYPQHAPSQK